MCNHPLPFHNKENEANSFTNIVQLCKTTQKKDKILIYSMNCREINDKPSYVFKTSKHNLDLALSMDPDRKTVSGHRSLLSYEKAYFDGMHRHCRGYKNAYFMDPPSRDVPNEKVCNYGSGKEKYWNGEAIF